MGPKNTIIGWIVGLFLILGVGVSRIYFGVHSISQIILGAMMSWAIFEIMQTIKPKYSTHLRNLEKTEMSESARILVVTMIFFCCSVACFFVVYIFNSAEVSLPIEYINNHSKCSHKCLNYYSYSCKGLAGLYVMPCVIYIAQFITILSSFRTYA